MASRRLAACCLRFSVVMGLLATVPVGRGAPDPVAFVEPARTGEVDERAPYAPGELLIKYRPGIGEAGRRELHAELGVVEARPLRPGLDRVFLDSGRVPDLVDAYRDHPAIAYVEPNHLIRAHRDPVDPFFADQYALRNTGQLGGAPGADIGAIEAWASSTGSHDVVVAIVDSGIDADHPDLVLNLWRNPGEIPENGVDDDGNGFVDDTAGWDFVGNDNDPGDDSGGHGTHVAGVVGAVGDNGLGTAGVAWKVRLLPVRILDGNGLGTVADAVAGVEYCASLDVDVVNASWGGAPFSRSLREAIEALAARDVPFVAAAGNDGRDTDERPSFPASFDLPNVISVAATDNRDRLASFSNFGATSVDLAAPGVTILSTLPGGFYEARSGTSFAAPHVSGAIALLRALAPNMSAEEIKRRLLDAVEAVPALAGTSRSGGRLHAARMLAGADTRAPAPVTDLRAVSATSNGVTLSWTASGDDGHEGRARRYLLRYADIPVDAVVFETARPVAGVPSPAPAGATESFEVRGLDPGTDHFFALRVEDEWGNRSPIGNTTAGRTLPAPRLVSVTGDLDFALFSGNVAERTVDVLNAGEGTLDWSAAATAPWLSAQPTSGRLRAGEGVSLTLGVDARGLAGGDYSGRLVLSSNDPVQPTVEHAVTLAVVDAPALVLQPARLDLGDVLVGNRGTATLVVSNPGSRPLEASLTAQGGVTPQPSALAIPAGERGTVTVDWHPDVPGPAVGLMSVDSNAAVDARRELAWSGTALPAPAIAVSPARVDERLFTGQTTRRVLRIDNPGDGPLRIVAKFAPDIARATDDTDRPVFVNGGFESGDFTGWIAESNGVLELTPWNVSERFGGYFGTADPLEGRYSAQNGFDGNAGLTYRLAQEILLPDDAAAATLVFHDRIQYDGFGIDSDEPRIYEAELVDLAGAPLAPILRHEVVLDGSGFTDTGWQRRELDVTPYLGRFVRVELRESIPESFTGPASIEFDAFRIERIAYPDWFRPAFPRLTVPPRGTLELPLDFDAGVRGDALLAGTLRLETNVPGVPRVPVEVSLAVDAAPDLVPPPTGLTFGDVPRGGVAHREIEAINRGAAPLSIVAAVAPPFSVTPSSLTVAPGESRRLAIAFAPTSEGDASATLRWTTNDPDTTAVAIALSGRGVAPPSLVLLGAPQEIAVAAGGSASLGWNVGNEGRGTLELTVQPRDPWIRPRPAALTIAPGSSARIELVVDASGLAVGIHPSVVELLSNDPDTPFVELPVAAEVFGVPRLTVVGARTVVSGERHYAQKGASTVHGLEIPSSPLSGNPRLRVTAQGDYGGPDETVTTRVGTIELEPVGGAGADCLAVTREYELTPDQWEQATAGGVARIVVAASAAVDPICDRNFHRVELTLPTGIDPLDWGAAAVGEATSLAVVVENAGSGLLELLASTSSPFDVDPSTSSIAPGERADLDLTLTPATAGAVVGSLTLLANDPVAPARELDLVADATAAGLRVSPERLELSAPEGGTAAAALVVTNAGATTERVSLAAVGGGPDALDLEPSAFELSPGASREVSVAAAGSRLAVGRTTFEARVSGDASRGRVVPVDVEIVRAPDVRIEAEARVESSIDFTGDSRSYHLLRTVSPPLGDGLLRVTAVGDYGAPGESATVSVEGGFVGRVDTVGADCVPQSLASILERGQLVALLADGRLEVQLANTSAVGSGCPENLHGVELSYPVAADRLDFGGAIPGETRRHRLWIRNGGSLPLRILSATLDGDGFSQIPLPPVIPPGGRRFVDVAFAASTAGRRDGNWSLETDDPDRPRIDVALTAEVLPAAAAAVDPLAVAATLAPGEVLTRAVTLSNAGQGPLEYAAELLPATTGLAVTGFRTGSVEPGGSAALELRLEAVAPGTHASELRIATSDPSRRQLRIPVTLDVDGPPLFALRGIRRIATSYLEFFVAGATTLHRLPVEYPFEDGARVEILARGDYGASGERAAVFAEGIELGTFGSSGLDCSTTGLSSSLDADRFAALAADGVVEIEVRNTEAVNPICPTNEQLVRLIYAEPPGEIRFGEVFVGRSADVAVVVANEGASDLQVEAAFEGDPAFEAAPHTLRVKPGDERTVLVEFSPPVAGDFAGELILRSDDPRDAERRLPVTATAVMPPRAVIADVPLEIEIPQGGGGTAFVEVGNAGGVDLEVTLVEVAEIPFLQLEPGSTSVGVGAVAELPVGYATRGRGPGTYSTVLRVETNDPELPRLDLPLTMTVTAAADIFIAGRRVVLESREEFAVPAARTETELALPVGPVGDVTVTLTAIGDFGGLGERATLAVGGIVLGEVGEIGTDCRPAEASFVIPQRRLDDFFPGGMASVDVINSPEVNAFCFLNRHVVRIEYDGPPAALDFPDTFTGQSSDVVVRIANRGAVPLTVDRILADSVEVEPPDGPWSIPPGASVDASLGYRPQQVGELAATLSIRSTDPDEPDLRLALRGRALPPPRLRLEPGSFRASLTQGEVESLRLRVVNDGGSELQWGVGWVELAELDADAPLPLGAGPAGFAGADYRWADSGDSAGPPFDWVETTGQDTGLRGDDEVSAPIALGFAFPFYGKSFDEVRISTDGWLSFTAERPSFSNPPLLPDAGFASPANLVAPFWDDLVVGAGSIRYRREEDRFIVEYAGVSRFGDVEPLTFQVQLEARGRIVFRYRRMAGRLDSATVGIQNGARDRGVDLGAAGATVEDGLAVELAPAPRWARNEPSVGAVPAGEQRDVELFLDASTLAPGSYGAALLLHTNDPEARGTTIPVVIEVEGQPSARPRGRDGGACGR